LLVRLIALLPKIINLIPRINKPPLQPLDSGALGRQLRNQVEVLQLVS
jgi:hypothetical protein